MRTVLLAAVAGLAVAGNLRVQNQFFGLPDIGNLINDGTNLVSDVYNGNVNGAVDDVAQGVGDAVGAHDLASDGIQTFNDALSGKASLTQIAEDGAKMVGDVTDYKDLINDGIKTFNDVASGNASPKDLIEDGVSLVGDAAGHHDIAADGIKAYNDATSGKASGFDLAKDGVSLLGDVTGQKGIASDVNTAIDAGHNISDALNGNDNGNSEEQFVDITPLAEEVKEEPQEMGEEIIETDSFSFIPKKLLETMQV